MLPLSGPGVAVLAVLVFFQTWNAFIQPLLYLPGTENQVLATGLYLFASETSRTAFAVKPEGFVNSAQRRWPKLKLELVQ
jgi:ABC-type glycerol-3-phosphate transport system permease component